MNNRTLLPALSFITLLLVVKTTRSVNAQPCLPGGIIFTSQAQIDAFATEYPGCTQILGNVTFNESISGGNITNLSGMSPLTSIGGDLEVFNNDALIGLTGLENLTSIGGDLYVGINAAMTNLTGLENLTSIEGSLYVDFNDALIDLSGLENLVSIGGGLYVHENTALTNLNGLDELALIEGFLNVASNTSLIDLSGLDNLTSIGGDLYIVNNTSLTDLSGLSNLTSIGGFLKITSNASLTNLSGLVTLTFMGGSLYVQDNVSLTDLNGLNNLTSIGGDLRVELNASLNDLSGLGHIDASTINILYLVNNPNLSVCEVKSICDYLDIPANPATISGNATGCNTRPEVEMACVDIIPVREILTLEQAIDIFPNPTSGSFKITGVEQGQTKIVDSMSRVVKKEANFSQEMDISDLPDGVYFILIHSINQLITKRIIKARK